MSTSDAHLSFTTTWRGKYCGPHMICKATPFYLNFMTFHRSSVTETGFIRPEYQPTVPCDNALGVTLGQVVSLSMELQSEKEMHVHTQCSERSFQHQLTTWKTFRIHPRWFFREMFKDQSSWHNKSNQARMTPWSTEVVTMRTESNSSFDFSLGNQLWNHLGHQFKFCIFPKNVFAPNSPFLDATAVPSKWFIIAKLRKGLQEVGCFALLLSFWKIDMFLACTFFFLTDLLRYNLSTNNMIYTI